MSRVAALLTLTGLLALLGFGLAAPGAAGAAPLGTTSAMTSPTAANPMRGMGMPRLCSVYRADQRGTARLAPDCGGGGGSQPTPTTITVKSAADTADVTGGGCTLRDALTVANNHLAHGDCAALPSVATVAFALPGDAPWTITLGSALPTVTVGLTLQGPGADKLTIRRDATATPAKFRLLTFSAGASAVTVSGVTLTGGDAGNGNGGGVFSSGTGTLAVTSSILRSNSASGGGGFYAGGGTMVTGSTLSGNSAAYGGGFYAVGAATVTGSTLSGNSAAYGGGFFTFAAATVTGSTLSGNSAAYGGGFFTFAAATVTGSTLSGNSATTLGGGFVTDTTATVTGSTLSGNSATNVGGFNARSTATVINTVFATGSSGENCAASGSLTDSGGNVSSDATCVAGGTGSLVNTDPQLAPLADNGGPTQTMALAAGSPARGLGVASACAANPTDQRGVARPATGCDSGAYQSDSAPAVTISVTPATLPGGTVGVAYSQQLGAGGGATPYSFAATGTLPPGLTLSTAGLLSGTPTTAGSWAFTVTATDANNATGTQDYTVAVAKGTATIALSGLGPYTYDGQAHAATATTTPAGLDTVALAYTNTATNQTSGTAPTNAGTYTVAATLDNPDYTAAPQTGTLTIGKATPTVSWSTPASIVYGTALSAAQLNATASGVNGAALTGTFAYTPAAGTVLHAGARPLGVLFTPDNPNYITATGGVTLTVRPAPLTVRPAAQQRQFGDAAPACAYDAGTPQGLVNGDTAATLGAPTCTSAATTTSAPGTYTLRIGTLATTDYAVTYQAATLTIGAKVLTPTLDGPATRTVPRGQPVVLTATVTPTGAAGIVPRGYVQFTVAGRALASVAVGTDGKGSYSFTPALAPGTYQVEVRYSSTDTRFTGGGAATGTLIITGP